jgi:acyl-CoA synthetase (AMP-forming)/AMP-acid ligase II
VRSWHVAAGRIVHVGRRLTQLARQKPNEVALIVERQDGGADTLTRLQLEQWANRLAHRLAEAGVKQKSFVAINLPNGLEHVVATLAAYKLGACPMPVSYRMSAAERDQLMALAEPAAVLSDANDLKGIKRTQMRALESYPATPPPDAVPQPQKAIASGGSRQAQADRDAEANYSYLGAKPIETADGDFASVGDLGYVDADSYLFLADRRVDLTITGGANVVPAEVEAVLTQHPGVRDAAVIGLKDEDLGRRVHALIEPANVDAPPTLEELDAHLRLHLASYKLPRGHEIVAMLTAR